MAISNRTSAFTAHIGRWQREDLIWVPRLDILIPHPSAEHLLCQANSVILTSAARSLEAERMTHATLARKVYDIAHLTGSFRLRSGLTSNEYFDKYQFESDPSVLREIAKQLVPLIPKGVDYLAALEMGGIPIATALSLECGIPVVFVRKQAKDYGTCKFAEGPQIKGKTLCMIEDVITTGGQVVISANDLRADGAIVKQVLCVIDRSEGRTEKMREAGIEHIALFTMAQLKP